MKKIILKLAMGCSCFLIMPQGTAQSKIPISKEKFHLYLLTGQSNMAGRAVVETQDTMTNPRILTLSEFGGWVPAREPLHFDKLGAGVGPGYAFAREMLNANDDVVIGLVPCAAGGSSIDVWKPGAYWEQTRSRPYNDAVVRTRLAMKDGTLKGILWHQGESDCAPGKAGSYKNKLTDLVAGLRREFGQLSVPFIAGEIQNFKYQGDLVNQALHDAKKDILFYDVVSGEGFSPMADNIHLDTRSERELGRRFAAKMKEMQQKPVSLADEKQLSFEWVFGDLVRLDLDLVKKVVSEQHGKRHYIDRDGDGKPEEVWFIDTSPRHNERNRPVLVRVIDEDGDLEMGGEPDLGSDLYIADWNADGTVDAVIDYEDLDGDQDVDQMGMYFFGGKAYGGLRVWWGRDDGDDNLLWYDKDYYYYQQPCEEYTHFGGDETFISLYIKPGDTQWTSFFENPFLFYDRDGDGVTEEVLRVSGARGTIHSIRWSFDVDNDATWEQQRDFDVSISAYAKGWSLEKDKTFDARWSLEKYREMGFDLHVGEQQSETLTIRGFPTGLVLKRNIATSFFRLVTWARVLMVWDENDLNKASDPSRPQYERWEGIIAAPSTEKGFEFPVIGGPDCGPFNKRYELVLNPKKPNEYYYHPADHRIHIKHSDRTWIKVDYDNDRQPDMYYLWTDTDKDGIMDKISIDINEDGKMDDSWNMDVSEVMPVDWTFMSLNAVYAPVVKHEPELIYYLNRALISALESVGEGKSNDPVWNMIGNRMLDHYSKDLAGRLVNSNESMLYFLTLSADRRIAVLKKLHNKKSFWKTFDVARSKGYTETMADMVRKEFKTNDSPEDYSQWLSTLRAQPVKKRVAWDNQWLPPNWGWESEKAAFRCYDGHFDLFGKRMDTLIYPNISKGKSYHIDQNVWGMDILHVGKTGGCGGLMLYVNDVAYPVRNEKNPNGPVFNASLLKETTDTVTIEFVAKGVGPKETPYTVYIRPSAIAGRTDSPVEVEIEGGAPSQKIRLGIVLNKLPVEDFFIDTPIGIMGLWGFQEPGIGWIGTGVIFPASKYLYMDEQPDEHRAVLEYNKGEIVRYHIQGDWLNGHRLSRSPGKQEWMNTLKGKARMLHLK